ncbi:MAG: acyltransferase [Acidithiobacillus sp.]|nr:acyltransferase [Acidithiobacillus sp.]
MLYLDYVKFLAILAVIAFHVHDTITFDFPWFSGGYLGVDIFLLLSGFLIEKSLGRAQEWPFSRRLQDFFSRRFSRIWVPMVVVTAIVAGIFWATHLLVGWESVWYSVSLGYNFYLAFHHVSYFQIYGYPHPFLGMWFISLLGQLYLLHFLLRNLLPWRWVYRILLFLLFLASVGGAIWLMNHGQLNAAYVLPTHAFPYIAGLLLADIGWATPKPDGKVVYDGLALLSICLLLSLFILAPYENYVYYSLAAMSLGILFLLFAARSQWLGVVRLPVLGKLGEMSYSFYLWNVPVIALIHYYYSQSSVVNQIFLSLSVLFFLSILSYWSLELPLQAAFRKQARHGVSKGFFLLALVLLAVAGGGWWQANRLGQENVRKQAQMQHDALYRQYLENRVKSLEQDLRVLAGTKTIAAAEEKARATHHADQALKKNGDLLQWQPKPAMGFLYNGEEFRSNSAYPQKQVLFITDSILLGWSGYVIHMVPNGILDGKVGRSFFRALPALQLLLQDPACAHVRYVVVELGSNGYVQWSDLENFVQAVGNRKILLIVPAVPRPWENEVRSLYDRAAAKYPNITLLHWDRMSANHPSYFVADQVHLTWDGAQALMQGVLRELYRMGYRNPPPPGVGPGVIKTVPSTAAQASPVSSTAAGNSGMQASSTLTQALGSAATGKAKSFFGKTPTKEANPEEQQGRESSYQSSSSRTTQDLRQIGNQALQQQAREQKDQPDLDIAKNRQKTGQQRQEPLLDQTQDHSANGQHQKDISK